MAENTSVQDVRVLVVEDEVFIRAMVARMLQTMGVKTVAEAEDGADGLNKLATFKPDLVVLDIMMKPMNGLEFLKQVRTGRSGYRRDLPVVVLTGASEQAVLGTAIALDCDAFVAKDKRPEVIEDRIVRVLGSAPTVKSAEAYDKVSIPDLSAKPGAPVAPAPGDVPSGITQTSVYKVAPGAVLARDLMTSEGGIILRAGEEITKSLHARLVDIAEIIDLPDLWVQSG